VSREPRCKTAATATSVSRSGRDRQDGGMRPEHLREQLKVERHADRLLALPVIALVVAALAWIVSKAT